MAYVEVRSRLWCTFLGVKETNHISLDEGLYICGY